MHQCSWRCGQAPCFWLYRVNRYVFCLCTCNDGIYGVLIAIDMDVDLVVTDDDNYLDSSSQHVGELKVVVHKVQVMSSSMKLPGVYPETLQPAKIHERSKKGVAHQIKWAAGFHATLSYQPQREIVDTETSSRHEIEDPSGNILKLKIWG